MENLIDSAPRFKNELDYDNLELKENKTAGVLITTLEAEDDDEPDDQATFSLRSVYILP